MKKGIAMVTLIVIISVMLILVSVITVTGIDTSNTSKKIAFASELKMLQDSVDSYRTNNEGEFPVSDFVVIDLSLANDQFQANGEQIFDNKVTLSKIDYTKLEISNLTYGMGNLGEDDTYVVSNKTGRVYYAKGLKIGKVTYYTLTDELKNLLKYNSKSDEVLSKDAIIFEPSTLEWTNSTITITIKVPLKYKNINVTTGTTVINNDASDSSYYIYKAQIDKNSDIKVKYFDIDNIQKTSSYSVINIDKQKPQISAEQINNSNTSKKCLKINVIESQSGIKTIKYDIDKINNDDMGKIYFSNNGTEVKNNIIEVEKDLPYITLYVEDNAGNYDISLLQLK